jgi:hypothetical protein
MHFCVARHVFRELYSSDTKSKYMALNRIFFAIVVGRFFLISAKFSKWWRFKEKLRFLLFFFWIKEWIKNTKINLSKKPPYDDSHLFSALCRSGKSNLFLQRANFKFKNVAHLRNMIMMNSNYIFINKINLV